MTLGLRKGTLRVSALALCCLVLGNCSIPSQPKSLGNVSTDQGESFCQRILLGPEIPQDDTDGGIGGTGILGVVTAAGQLKLGKTSFLYDPEARVTSPLGSFAISELQIGDTVVVTVQKSAQNTCATGIAQYLPVIGPISGIATGKMAIMGATVNVGSKTYVETSGGAEISMSSLQPGQRVAVSGLWRSDEIEATRILLLSDTDRGVNDTLTGPVHVGSDGDVFVGGVRAELPVRDRAEGRQITVGPAQLDLPGPGGGFAGPPAGIGGPSPAVRPGLPGPPSQPPGPLGPPGGLANDAGTRDRLGRVLDALSSRGRPTEVEAREMARSAWDRANSGEPTSDSETNEAPQTAVDHFRDAQR